MKPRTRCCSSRCTCSVAICSVFATTVMDKASAFSFSLMSLTSKYCPEARVTGSETQGSNPSACTVTRYESPGATFLNSKKPLSFALWFSRVGVLLPSINTVAPGMTSPFVSVTVPLTSPASGDTFSAPLLAGGGTAFAAFCPALWTCGSGASGSSGLSLALAIAGGCALCSCDQDRRGAKITHSPPRTIEDKTQVLRRIDHHQGMRAHLP